MAATNENDEKAVLAVHHARLAAIIDGDLDALDRFVGEDMIYVSPVGKVQTKPEVWGSFRSGRVKVEKMDSDDISVSLYGDVAITRYRAQSRIVDGDETIEGTTRATSVYVMRDGRWQLVSAHNCLVR